MKPIIAVVGGSTVSTEVYQTAREVGRSVAESGALLVTGGLGGVMEAASQGAKEKGGTVIGILPGFSRQDVNPYVDIPIVTGLGDGRNMLIVQTAQALIALPGEYGTLSEIALALKIGRPVVSLGSWEISPDILKAQTPREAVEKAMKMIDSRRP
ncbi:MAG TPA: TIGR00725 family protein [candidate division Zixibacteria bacterium]|nr:TIGR00725 family protein [candidate division Zixibacteria bacterium]